MLCFLSFGRIGRINLDPDSSDEEGQAFYAGGSDRRWVVSYDHTISLLFVIIICVGFSPFMGETDGETFSNINR